MSLSRTPLTVSKHSYRWVLTVVLVIAVLSSVLVASPAVMVAGAQQTNATNTSTGNTTPTTAANASVNTSANTSANTTTPLSASATDARAPSNSTANTSANASGGRNASQLAALQPNAARGNQSGNLTNWVKKLAQMNPSQAKQAVQNNPQKAARMTAALKTLGVENPKQMVHQQPRQAARQVAGILAIGDSSNGTASQNNSSAGGQSVTLSKCSGGFVDSAMCKARNALFGWVIGGIVSFVQGVITGIVNMIVGLPIPMHNGQPAFFQQPTNQPWKGLYNSWLTLALPLGILEWALMVLGVMFSQVYISDPSKELKRRELKSRTWKVLFGVVGSWAIGVAILFITNGVILTVAPDGTDIASNLAVFTGSLGALGAAGLLIWFFEGVLFLFILLLLLAQKASVFILMWSLPILIPLAAFDVGPVELLSKPARGIIDTLIPFIFMTLPMALVLRVGYVVVNSLNQTTVAQVGMWASGANTGLILGFWIMAAVSPLFVFSQTGKIKGFAAGMLGVSIASNSGGLKEKVESAKERVPDANPPPNVTETTDINEGKNEGTYGGPLPYANDKPSMLTAGYDLPETTGAGASSLDGASSGVHSPRVPGSGSTMPGMAEAGDPELPPGQPLPGGDGDTAGSAGGAGTRRTTATSSGTGTSGQPITRESVTRVRVPRDLPTETTYQVGHVKDNGEFQPLAFNSGTDRSALLTGTYNRLNTGTERYRDEKLLLRSEDDGSFYDMDSMTYREQSYEQMSKDTSENVLNT